MLKVAVIGGGIAGMQTALRLRELGIEPIIFERDKELGGKVRNWHLLFPTFTESEAVLMPLKNRVAREGIEVRLGVEVREFDSASVTLATGEKVVCEAVVVCTGFTIFDARVKDEYGYGIYDNVFTSVDVERMFVDGEFARWRGKQPERIAILHCVGSRDEKVCQRHCSKVCCVTGVKQAIELKRCFPNADIFNFYMDMRMFGPGYEELYHTAQREYGIHFVRGRISEASPLMEGRVQIKAEDTLTGRPLRMSVDMLILLVGMKGNKENAHFAKVADLCVADNGFMQPKDHFVNNTCSMEAGIFYAGTITAPKSIGEVLNEANTVAGKVSEYLKDR